MVGKAVYQMKILLGQEPHCRGMYRNANSAAASVVGTDHVFGTTGFTP